MKKKLKEKFKPKSIEKRAVENKIERGPTFEEICAAQKKKQPRP